MSAGTRRWTVSLPCLVLAALVLMFAVPQRGMAQVLYGSILGDVKDTSGAYIPGAAVVVTNKSTGLARQGITDEAGRFTFAAPPPGVFNFKTSGAGLQTIEQN